jgi:long-chain acyl-CoA synthetase
VIPETHLSALFFNRASRWNNRTFLERKTSRGTFQWTWKESSKHIESVTLYLLSQNLTSEHPCAIISENRPEWLWTDLGILTAASYDVPLYPTSTPEEILYCLNDSRARFLFLSNEKQLAKIQKVEEDLKYLEEVITFENLVPKLHKIRQTSFQDLLDQGKLKHQETSPDWLEQQLQRITPDHLATVIYTSGTTGLPKGVMLTHSNFLFNVRSSSQALPVGLDDHYLSFLPLNHVFERMAGFYLMVSQGARITYLEDLDSLAAEISEVRPTLMCGVPRFYEKIYTGILKKVESQGGLAPKIFAWALQIGRQRLEKQSAEKLNG